MSILNRDVSIVYYPSNRSAYAKNVRIKIDKHNAISVNDEIARRASDWHVNLTIISVQPSSHSEKVFVLLDVSGGWRNVLEFVDACSLQV